MYVTQILPLDKKRSRVYLDEQMAFVLYKGELRRFGIAENTELAEGTYHTIVDEVLLKRAKLRAMNLLKERPYTEAALRSKLQAGYYPESVLEAAIQYVSSFGYVDDARFAEDYIRSCADRKSRTRLKQDLFRKGVSQDLIEKAFLEAEESGESPDEDRQIRDLLMKKHFDPSNSDLKERQRLYGFLMRRGYSSGAIRKAMEIDEDFA